MKQKSFFVGLTIAAIILSVLSIFSVSKVFSANPQNLFTNLQPQAAQFLPKRSPLVASFLFNPEQLNLAAKLATKVNDRRNFDQEISQLKKQLQQTWYLNYEQDIKPWLGAEVTLAVTTPDLDRDPKNGLQAGYLIALATQKPELAQKYLDRFWQKQAKSGADLAFEQYQGVSLISTTISTTDSRAIANAKVGKFILFANDVSVIRNAINNLQSPSLALASSPEYQNSLQQLTNQGFAIAYLNPSEIQGLLGSEKLEGLTEKLPITLTIGLQSNDLGIKAETILALGGKTAISASGSHDNMDILKYISGGSSLLVGHNLAQTLASISDRPPLIPAGLQTGIDKVTQSLDFILAPENLSWIQDQYAIAIPKESNSNSWLLVIEAKNFQQASSALAELDNNARTKSKFTVGEIQINNQPLTLWTKLAPSATDRIVTGKVALAHTELNSATESINKSAIQKYVLISNSIATIQAALTQPSILETDPVFKAIANVIGTQNGLAYLSAQHLRSLLTLEPPILPLSLLQNRIQSLAIANTKIVSEADTTFLNGQMILNWAKPKDISGQKL
ncbi:DUF3352 domain-containing protein [Synechococcus sp. PCC 7502]|uniref:DUF3352 domain-containing protein n=1 Tax=Synechococcus sp. PCC 7502 TaxID=1173263 RepID=UPI0002E5A323|nr:DUF3352 domain-containing protein [Synechococcus sp. PCC 7502]